jgi:hypothetical protein
MEEMANVNKEGEYLPKCLAYIVVYDWIKGEP